MSLSALLPRLRAALLSSCRKGILSEPRFASSLRVGDPSSLLDSEIDPDLDPESLDLKSLLKRQKKAVLYQRLRREMEPRGPPERSLTWMAMEQIRHLYQEFPEEWTVHRLAEGFNVNSDVIKRVLRSNFSASPQRRIKQDAKVAARLESRQSPRHTSINAVQTKIQAGYQTSTCLLSGKPHQQQKQICDGHSAPRDSLSSKTLQHQPSTLSLIVAENDALRKWKRESQSGTDDSSKADFMSAVPLTSTNSNSKTDEKLLPSPGPMKEKWNREILSEEELDRVEEAGQENRIKIVQKGREFFDSDGNFLYRI